MPMMLRMIVFILITFMMNISMVMCDRMIRFTFNDGISPTPNQECTIDDNRYIDPLFHITIVRLRRRQLMMESNVDAPTTIDSHDYEKLYHHHHRRELYAASCRNNCAGYARGTCRATGCIGYRRREQERTVRSERFTKTTTSSSSSSSSSSDPTLMVVDSYHREDLITSTCDGQVAEIHAALDDLILSNQISVPCQAFLTKSKRTSECFDDVVYGEILSFTFYNMNMYNTRQRRPIKVTALQTNVATTGFTICSNIAFNVEAILNPCVQSVTFTMTGPNGYQYTRADTGHPMLLFETATATTANFGGQHLTPGEYHITARPDDYAYKERYVDFTVIAC